MEKQVKTQAQIEQEMLELNKQFGEFLHTKGIAAKFKLAFANMGDSAKKQHEAGVRSARGQYTAESLAEEFNEFLKMKGLDTRYTVEIKDSDED